MQKNKRETVRDGIKNMLLECRVCHAGKPHGAFVCDECVTKITRKGRIVKSLKNWD